MQVKNILLTILYALTISLLCIRCSKSSPAPSNTGTGSGTGSGSGSGSGTGGGTGGSTGGNGITITRGTLSTALTFDAQGNLTNYSSSDEQGSSLDLDLSANSHIKARLLNGDKGTMTVTPVTGIPNTYDVQFSNINHYMSAASITTPNTTDDIVIDVYTDDGSNIREAINSQPAIKEIFQVPGSAPNGVGSGKINLQNFTANQSTITSTQLTSAFNQARWSVYRFNVR